MKSIKHYNLPEITHLLYENEAMSSIALSKGIARKINELVDAYNALAGERLTKAQEQDGKINKAIIYMKDNIYNTLHDMFEVLKEAGDFDDMITDVIEPAINTAIERTSHMVNVKEFGAIGNGFDDDTDFIQSAIDHANSKGRTLYIPAGEYRITKPIVLNGCSIHGECSNIFSGTGVVIKCDTKDFTAIKQGSTSSSDCMFNISNILVKNADVAFEINYAINSTFSNLSASECNTGFKLGDANSVGSMFCNFNNFYTNDCEYGIVIESNQYFNNNKFTNGFILGNKVAMKMKVNGGYGAVGNKFENVEFRSGMGRGVVLTSCINTNFSSCYFETGGNAVRCTNYCTVDLNDCTYALYKTYNEYDDKNIVYTVGGSMITIDNGVIFLDSNYDNIYFYGSGNNKTYDNFIVTRNIVKIGTAENYNMAERDIRDSLVSKNEQITVTETFTVPANGSIEIEFKYAKPYDYVPNITIASLRGECRGISHGFRYRTAEGGTLSVTNTSTGARAVSFAIYSKRI